jgi:chromate transporter
MRDNVYLDLVVVLAPLSLAAVGGATGLYAPFQHEFVELRHWITQREFVDLFAVARLAPGPSSMLAPMIAFRFDGFVAALVAALALYLPSSALVYATSLVWTRYRDRPWRKAVEQGLAPVAAGLVLSGVLTLLRVVDGGPIAWVTVAVVAALMLWRPKLHPLPFLGAGAALFLLAHFLGAPV